jgi:hypothetical protein
MRLIAFAGAGASAPAWELQQLAGVVGGLEEPRELPRATSTRT